MSGHNRWSTIKHKKALTDAKKSKGWTKLIKEVTVAARGGGDPVNIAAWTGDATAAALSAEWAARCIGGTNGLCDCTRGTASCVEGTCRGTTYDCFAPHDAGVQ